MNTPRRYAQDTTVPVEKSRYEIEVLLKRHGAAQFAYASAEDRGVVMCRLGDRMLRFEVPQVGPKDCAQGPERRRSAEGAVSAAAAENRRRWRALLLIIKAKLEMVAGGLSTVEREFLADVLLPDGSTVGQYVGPAIAESYASGGMPKLLLGSGA